MSLEAAPSNVTRVRSWLRNVGCGYLDLATGALIYVLLTPLLVRLLGIEAYAIWIISHTVTFYLGFLDLGITQAQIRFHARFAARGRRQAITQLLATSASLLTMAGLSAALIACAMAMSAPMQWLDVPETLTGDFRLVLVILGINLLVAFPGSVLASAYEGAQRFDLAALRSIALRLLTAAAQFWSLQRGHGVVTLAALELCASVLRLLFDLCVLPHLAPGALREPVRRTAGIWKRMRSFALWSSVDDLVVEGTAHLDQVLIAALLPLAMLTPYSLCMSAGAILMVVVEPIVETFFPMAAGLHARGNKPELRQLMLTGTKVVVAIATPIAIVLMFFGNAALTLWIPEIESELPTGLLQLIVANMLVSVFMWTPNLVLMALNRVRAVAILTLVEVLLALVLILVLVPSYGLAGIAAGALIANILAGLALQLPLVRAATGISVTHLIVSALGRVSLASMPAVAVACWLAQSNDSFTWLRLFATTGAVGLTYVLGLLLYGFTREERDRYLRFAAASLKTQPSES